MSYDINLNDYPRLQGELIDSVNYLLDSYDIILTDCYADTGMTGYRVLKNARLRGCSYFNNYTYGMDDVTVIDHRGGSLLVSEGLFRKTSPHATLYKGDPENILWVNNILDGEFDDLNENGFPVRQK